jgi:hypothetical protein
MRLERDGVPIAAKLLEPNVMRERVYFIILSERTLSQFLPIVEGIDLTLRRTSDQCFTRYRSETGVTMLTEASNPLAAWPVFWPKEGSCPNHPATLFPDHKGDSSFARLKVRIKFSEHSLLNLAANASL